MIGQKRINKSLHLFGWHLLILSMALVIAGCTTKYGATVSADRVVPSDSKIDRLGPVSGMSQAGGVLWAKLADRALYEQARREALAQRSGDLLLDVEVTTRLISYLGLYYLTSVTVEGIAAKVTPLPLPITEAATESDLVPLDRDQLTR
jgi:hypothetical protein